MTLDKSRSLPECPTGAKTFLPGGQPEWVQILLCRHQAASGNRWGFCSDCSVPSDLTPQAGNAVFFQNDTTTLLKHNVCVHLAPNDL